MFVIKKIIPFLCVFAILFSFPVTGLAADTDTDYKQQADFWTWIAGGNSLLKDLIGYTTGAVCPKSEDGYHHASSYVKSHEDGLYTCICDVCGDRFVGYSSDAQQSYADQVAELPAAGVDSDGYLYWKPEYDYSYFKYSYSSISADFYWGNTSESSSTKFNFSVINEHDPAIFSFYPENYTVGGHFNQYCYGVAPIDGYYYFPVMDYSGYYISSGVRYEIPFSNGSYTLGYSFYKMGDSFSRVLQASISKTSNGAEYAYLIVSCKPIRIQPLSGLIDPSSDTTYTITSRPASITGDYGIIGDNGQITKVESTTIVNETNNTFTNPSTGTTSTITDWTYDYSDRSYDLTLDTGDTVTVTYGDENITIQEGDTVYNIYYIVDGTGQDTDPDVCQHTYTSTVDREATCTIPGQTTYTCSLCGHIYTEAIPAKGHTWTVLQTVTTEYDQEGNLLQQGYTIYQCSVCGEQYKDETGTGPPDSGGGAGTDGESVWDKLGNFLGTVFGAIIGLIEAILGPILDALTTLAAMIGEKLATVVNLVVSMFTEIPPLFTGFLGFLSAVFPFLPEDIMTLLTFGIAVVVFIGIIKALRR